MRPIKNTNVVLIAPFFTVILLVLPLQAQADWSDAGMHSVPAPNFSPNQEQPIHHEAHVNVTPAQHIEPQHHAEPQHRVEQARPAEHQAPPVVNRVQPVRHDQPARHDQKLRHDQPDYHFRDTDRHVPGYFRRDVNYYGQAEVVFPFADVEPSFVVPDGYQSVVVDGQIYFYNDGVFYQQAGNQLAAIPPVLGAVVDSIPQDYQIVIADGAHYLFTGGIYYQRVDQGFEVVAPPDAPDL
jgi:hypothetical protein